MRVQDDVEIRNEVFAGASLVAAAAAAAPSRQLSSSSRYPLVSPIRIRFNDPSRASVSMHQHYDPFFNLILSTTSSWDVIALLHRLM